MYIVRHYIKPIDIILEFFDIKPLKIPITGWQSGRDPQTAKSELELLYENWKVDEVSRLTTTVICAGI
jgi:hypothetical protein